MPRKPIERSHENYYHITARSNNKEFFYLSTLNVWDIMTEKLAKLQSAHQIKIGAFVLMSNHFHLLILTPIEDIDRIMYFFMKEVTLDIQKCAGRINKIFGGRYKGSMITGHDHLINVYKYIYRNPVEVGLADRAELYLHSTLFYKNHPHVRCSFNLETILFPHTFDSYDGLDELTWLNQKYEKCEADSVSRGLQKTIFAYEKDKLNNRPIEPVVRCPKKTQDKLYL